MNHIDLFSGIGGFALAASRVWESDYQNLGHSEIEDYACQIYHYHFPTSQCLGDVTKIDWTKYAGKVDFLTGGFPCQPHSLAGKRKASKDERDLWKECIRALRNIQPQYGIFENVPGLLTSEKGKFFNQVLTDIHESGYDAEWQVISARDVGANHLRKRIWIVVYPQNPNTSKERRSGIIGSKVNGLDTHSNGLQTPIFQGEVAKRFAQSSKIWESEPNMDRMVDGISNGLDRNSRKIVEQRLAGLGNAIVPQCAELIFNIIKHR
jgi:DNA-cytosine methyltransferase